ncbi:hypothetical protein C8Q74DRAFT_281689 [Fomes fomentarius]|nr:hypothetical protein C8Q74DRAFT_281689 [Fomes fomentarius]
MYADRLSDVCDNNLGRRPRYGNDFELRPMAFRQILKSQTLTECHPLLADAFRFQNPAHRTRYARDHDEYPIPAYHNAHSPPKPRDHQTEPIHISIYRAPDVYDRRRLVPSVQSNAE